MEIFNSQQEHDTLSKDLELVYTCFNDVKSRLAEKTLDNLIERIVEEMQLNITARAATEVARLEQKYPDEDFVTLVNFLAWKQDVHIEDNLVTLRDNLGLSDDAKSVRLYGEDKDFFIEVDGTGTDGRHFLTIENSSWSEPETPLEAMEMHLFRFYRLNKESE